MFRFGLLISHDAGSLVMTTEIQGVQIQCRAALRGIKSELLASCRPRPTHGTEFAYLSRILVMRDANTLIAHP
jgi:hypothetical protein